MGYNKIQYNAFNTSYLLTSLYCKKQDSFREDGSFKSPGEIQHKLLHPSSINPLKLSGAEQPEGDTITTHNDADADAEQDDYEEENDEAEETCDFVDYYD